MAGAAFIVLAAVWFALVTGALEVAFVGARALLTEGFTRRTPHYVWMTPVAYVLLFVPAGLLLAALHRWLPRLLSLRTAIGLLALASAGSLLVLLAFDRLHPAALALLAVGAAVQAARMAAAYPVGFARLVRRGTIVLALGVAAGAAGVVGWRVGAERMALAALGPARAGAPNVLLIILDTVRAANLSLYGYERPTTPRLERFARRGVVFERAIAPAPWTLPSHASMFTGRWPHELSTGWLTPLDDRFPTLAEAFRDAGYLTAGFTANFHYTAAETGLSRGFIRYEDLPVGIGQIFRNAALTNTIASLRRLRPLIGTDEVLARKDAARITDDFLRWLDRHGGASAGAGGSGTGGRPFFAFLNYFDAHDPYLPPPEHIERVSGRVRRDALSPFRRIGPNGLHAALGPEAAALERDAYDGAIAYIDQELGRLFDDLERRGVLDHTIVVITSDHGEEFGEHGLFLHGHTLYLPALHVPLIIAAPRRGVPAGLRIAEPVSLRGLAATLAELAELRPAEPFPGTSFALHWRNALGNDAGVAVAPEPILSEVQQGVRIPDRYPSAHGDMAALLARGIHYIRNGDGSEELYDVLADPWQANNLAPIESFRPALLDLRTSLNEAVSSPRLSLAPPAPEPR